MFLEIRIGHIAWKSNIGVQGNGSDGFQLNHFRVAQWNFCDVVNVCLDAS